MVGFCCLLGFFGFVVVVVFIFFVIEVQLYEHVTIK